MAGGLAPVACLLLLAALLLPPARCAALAAAPLATRSSSAALDYGALGRGLLQAASCFENGAPVDFGGECLSEGPLFLFLGP